jgi:hypothetical protein
MKTLCKFALISSLAVGGVGFAVGCDDTVSKHEETKMNSDGSSKKETETVKQSSDGTVKTEKTMEKTPATQPSP